MDGMSLKKAQESEQGNENQKFSDFFAANAAQSADVSTHASSGSAGLRRLGTESHISRLAYRRVSRAVRLLSSTLAQIILRLRDRDRLTLLPGGGFLPQAFG